MQKKLLSIFFIIILSFLVFPIISNASDYLYLNDLEFQVQINSDGSMNVTEIWDIDIEDTNTLFKTFEIDEEKYSSITDVKVTDITNGINNEFTKIDSYMYHVTKNCYYGLKNEDGDFEIAWGIGLDNENETRKYKIEYKVNNVIAKYIDYAELYWQFIGNDFEIDADKVKGIIYLPTNVTSKENIKVWAHSKDLNGTIYATSLNMVEFNMDNYNSGRYLEVRVLFQSNLINTTNRIYNSNIFEKAVAEETEWAEEANRKRKLNESTKKILQYVGNILIIMATVYFCTKIKKYRMVLKDLNKLQPTHKIDYYRDLPDENATPGEALFLENGFLYGNYYSYFGQIFSATLLNLTLKRYIELKVDKDKNGKESIRIINLNKEITNLKDDEKGILEFILKAIGKKEEISMKELERYISKKSESIDKLMNKTFADIKKNLKQSKHFEEENYNKHTKYFLFFTFYTIGAIISILPPISIILIIISKFFILLPIIFIINAVYCNKIMKKINVLTQTGLDQSEMWKGLKKYMEEFSLLNEKEVPALVLWEKYLVYATAFGISDKVLKQLKIVYPNIDDVEQINTSTYMYFMYHSNFNKNFSKAINSSISSAYSSASGSGGGFSGGGGRRWRWPEAEEEDKNYLFL